MEKGKFLTLPGLALGPLVIQPIPTVLTWLLVDGDIYLEKE
jgi:hypothetical protein